MIGPRTELYCLIGHPVSKSLSPAMFNRAFKVWRFDAVYLAFDVPPERLGKAVEGLRVLSKGFNVTIPHKSAIMEHLDWAEGAARAIGAVNTVKVEGEKLMGYNTDWQAVYELLEPYRVEGRPVILGAGGAARAVVYALKELGFTDIIIVNRGIERAKRLQEDFSKLGVKLEIRPLSADSFPPRLDLFVNATPLGMYEDSSILEELLPRLSNAIVVDLAYSPEGTCLERASPGRIFISGLEILVEQAARAFEIWTDLKAPRDEMRRAVGIEG